MVGIRSSIISNWRRGATQPDLANLRKLAEAAGVAPVRLYALAGRLHEGDIEGDPMPAEPLPHQIRALIDFYRSADDDTRVVLLGQVEFLVESMTARARAAH